MLSGSCFSVGSEQIAIRGDRQKRRGQQRARQARDGQSGRAADAANQRGQRDQQAEDEAIVSRRTRPRVGPAPQRISGTAATAASNTRPVGINTLL